MPAPPGFVLGELQPESRDVPLVKIREFLQGDLHEAILIFLANQFARVLPDVVLRWPLPGSHDVADDRRESLAISKPDRIRRGDILAHGQEALARALVRPCEDIPQ